MKLRKHVRVKAAALAAVLLLSLCWPAAALAAEDGTVSIRRAEELVELSRKCSLDTWSQGKTVVLEADIDLRGVEFSPIPTFGGTFQGNGHTISGLSLADGASYQGLFRYVQKGAVVRDLHVAGTVTAAGEQACLGGIAGSNEGTILACSFRGTVKGKSQVGGIAGINESTGSIYGCTVVGPVTGEKNTGGIAGQNGGIITGCINKGAVNTVHQEKEQSLEESLDRLNAEEVLDSTTDTGGIAGSSNGVLRNCRNEGSVGYAHVGYNVGGVVGRSSGYLENCVNSGTVLGRKDVGGVAGQIAPNIRLIFTQDTIEELKDALSLLNDMVKDTLNHTDSSRDTIFSRLDQLSGYAQSAFDNAGQLSDAMSGWADGNIAAINDAADALADTLDRMEALTRNGEGILNTMADGMDLLEDSLTQMSQAMGIGKEGLDALGAAMDRFQKGIRQARDAFDGVRKSLHDLSNALVVDDPEAAQKAQGLLENGTEQLCGALDQCAEALEGMAEIFLAGGPEDPELQAALSEYLGLLAHGFRSGSEAFAQIGKGVLTGITATSLDWDAVKDSAKGIAASLESLSGVCGTMGSSVKKLREAVDHCSDLSGVMESALADLADAMDAFEEAARDIGDAAGQIHDLFDDLSSREPIQFDALGDDFHRAEDGLNSAVNGLGGQMDLLRDEMDASGDTLSADIRAMGDQFQVIAGLVLDAFSDARDVDEGDLWDDVSEEFIDNTTLGKARGCSNLGAVKGDLNVGGITGAMAIEYDFDPEDDITEVGEESFHFRYETRAILQECINRGAVTGKKDAAGGVVGRMELGYVLNCENYGTARSSDGDYVGGIAGISKSTIRGCWSKCTLSGGSYVGGIVGYGCELYRCVSMTAVGESDGYTGSVAGEWDRKNGAIAANRFVEGPLAGVDGISYAGQAEPVAYEALIREEGVPQPFRSLTLTYVVEDDIFETVSYSYGQPVNAREIPRVPEKEGYYGAWEEVGEERITIDHVVKAFYTPYTTTLASEAMRDRVHPVFLVEGVFDENAALRVEQTGGGGNTERWAVALTGDDGEEHCVRFAAPAEWESCALFLLTEEGRSPIRWEQEGSCCVFTVSGSGFAIEAVEQHSSSFGFWMILSGGLFAAAALCFVVVRVRRSKKQQGTAAAHG